MSSISQSTVLSATPVRVPRREPIAPRDYVTAGNGLPDLDAGWPAGDDRDTVPTSQHAWISACASAFARERAMHVVAAWRDGQMTAIAPLRWRLVHGVRHGVVVGVDELHEPADLIYRDSDALRALVTALIGHGSPLIFGRLPANAPTVRLFQEIEPGAVVICRPKPPCPFIPLDDTWLEPELHLNARRRSDLRRARRRAERIGPVDFQILSPRPELLHALLEEAFQIEASGWKGEARTALQFDADRADFYRAYATAAARAGILRLCFLSIGGRRAAMQLAVQSAGGFWLLKIGYHARFDRCSPGLLLMRETIRYAAQAGLRSYEFLGLSAPWIEAWTRQVRPCVSLRVYPRSLRGMAALTSEAAAALLRRCAFN